MNQPEASQAALPGLESLSVAPLPEPASANSARPRVRAVNRSQLTWQMLDVERLIELDHPARATRILDGWTSRARGTTRGRGSRCHAPGVESRYISPIRPPTRYRLSVSAKMITIKCEPDGAANGSQPIRSETNRTSSAAGSRR